MEAKKPVCKLSGVDGNVFIVIGTVSKCLLKANLDEQAKEFRQKAMSAPSYDAVLQLCFKYVDVE